MRVALVGDYEFEEAETVAEAIEVADRFRPDIALVDLMMPGGSGLEVVRHLKADPALQHAGCVVVSAFAAEADQEEARGRRGRPSSRSRSTRTNCRRPWPRSLSATAETRPSARHPSGDPARVRARS